MNRLLAFLKNITEPETASLQRYLDEGVLPAFEHDAVILTMPESILHNCDSTDKLAGLESAAKAAGMGCYICQYRFEKSELLTENDGFIQRYIPLTLVFFKDAFYEKIRKNTDIFIKMAAFKNITRFADTDIDVCAFAGLPKVALVITSYNYEKYIGECMDSVIEQDYPYVERYIVDDCSMDGSAKIIKEKGSAFRLITHEVNSGQLKAFFTGALATDAEFIVFVDADDLLDSRTVSAHLYVHLFCKPNVAFSCLRNNQISASGRLLNNYHLDFANHGERLVYVKPRVIHTPTWSWSTTSAMMFRTDMVKMLVTENTEPFRICADYYLVHFCNLLGGSMLFDEPLVSYRRHGRNNFSKNLVIGGHRPTGHSEIHGHPSHFQLQKTIVGLMLDKIDVFEPYFPTIERFAETMGFVMEPDAIVVAFKTDKKLSHALRAVRKSIFKIKKSQIRKRNYVVRLGNFIGWFRSIKLRMENYIKTYVEK